MASPKATIPQGSWVLVTGAAGFVGSHVTKQFLERGYKVRGTVRNISSDSWLVKDLLKSYADSGALELVEVPDMNADNAFDDAVKGMSAILHIATVVPLSNIPDEVIPTTVAGVLSIVEAAAKEPSVRSFVYTGSIAASAWQFSETDVHVDRNSWNEVAVDIAYKPPPYHPAQHFIVYQVSKVRAAQALLKYAEERKPHFSINIPDPASILGQPLQKKHVGKAGDWVKVLWDNDDNIVNLQPYAYIVDVKDVALLHVALALDPDMKNVRIQTWGHTDNVTWSDVLAIMKKLRPNRKFIDLPRKRMNLYTDQSEAIALLKKWGGPENKDGYRALESTIEDAIKGIEHYYP